ncbi:MAG TPA: hypothetical protein VMX17_17010 [Candidatus Glassbacteria bacterium]|nr:hypothetical protein [Candidatus Glassbacteria bacterium]
MTPKDLDTWKQLRREISNLEEEKIYPKIDKIIQTILKAFNKNTHLYNWYFVGAPEGEVGMMEIVGGNIAVVIDCTHNLSTSTCDYNVGFPVNFLFMDTENIITYIKKERNNDAVITRTQAEIKRRAQQKLFNTFTKEEIKALGLKL